MFITFVWCNTILSYMFSMCSVFALFCICSILKGFHQSLIYMSNVFSIHRFIKILLALSATCVFLSQLFHHSSVLINQHFEVVIFAEGTFFSASNESYSVCSSTLCSTVVSGSHRVFNRIGKFQCEQNVFRQNQQNAK